jgi:hypothetical protein
MRDKEYFIDKYKALKQHNTGRKLLLSDFVKFCDVKKNELERIFGKDPYSKLQEACGDKPNKLQLERTSLSEILDQYGVLVREHQRIPVSADWLQAELHPSPDGLKKVHKISLKDLPEIFVENYKDKVEWHDVLRILKRDYGTNTPSGKGNRKFCEIVDKINTWTPNRKRVLEEGYKIELRNHLEKYFDLEEESGESNADLLIDRKYPIELKKDPSLSEYDRLLGQMIRHNKQYGNAIAVITSISSEDRYKKFQKLFVEIHAKLGMTAEIINK